MYSLDNEKGIELNIEIVNLRIFKTVYSAVKIICQIYSYSSNNIVDTF